MESYIVASGPLTGSDTVTFSREHWYMLHSQFAITRKMTIAQLLRCGYTIKAGNQIIEGRVECAFEDDETGRVLVRGTLVLESTTDGPLARFEHSGGASEVLL